MAENATDAKATLSLNLEGNVAEKSAEDAAALEALRARIVSGTDAIRQNNAAMKSLRGSSTEVTTAREQLKARLDSEKDAVSALNLQLLKQGTTYQKVTEDARKLENEQKRLAEQLKAKGIEEARDKSTALGNAVKLAGGPVAELKGRFEALKAVLGTSGAVMAGLVLVTAGLVAGVVALTTAFVSAGVDLVKFIAVGADAARSMNILRLATTKTEDNARNLGTQVDELAQRLSAPKEELNTLAAQLGRTRLSGQAIVDSFNAVGRASDAMGDDVGNTLRDIITRGQTWNRFQLNPLELQGKGISFQDVAGELAKNLKVGVGAAQQALFTGTVTIDQGAKALRQAVEKNFSKINDAKLLSLDSQTRKFHEDLQALTSGVNLDPLLRGFAELRGLFSQSTVMGATLKAAITTLGNTFGPTFEAALPAMKQLFKGAVIGALDVGIAFLQLRNTTRDTLKGTFGDIDYVHVAEFNFKVLANTLNLLRVSIVAVDLAWRTLKLGFGGADNLQRIKDDLARLGGDSSQGLADGLRNGAADVGAASKELGQKTETGYKDELKIHSPSRVMFDAGEDSTEGITQGIRSRGSSALSAMSDVASGVASSGSSAAAAAGGGGAGGGGGASIVLQVQAGAIVIQTHGATGKDVAQELMAPSFLAQLTAALQVIAKASGLPSQAVHTP